jgi:transcription-repair coupling factor (superfamily II helicase)
MILTGLLSLLRRLPAYAQTVERLRSSVPQRLALAAPRAVRPPLAAALAEDSTRPTLLVTARPDRALALAAELTAWAPALRLFHFLEPNALFYEPAPWGARAIRARITALAALAPYHGLTPPSAPPPVIVTSARALMTRTLPRREFLAHTRTLRVGQSVRLEKLLESWMGIGYDAQTVVVEPGRFSRRGGIVDVYPMADELPVRIELFGDEIETLRRFDPATQRSGERIDSVTITPAREALPKYAPARIVADTEQDQTNLGLLDYELARMYPPASLIEHLPAQALILIEDWQELADTVAELEEHALEQRNLQREAGTLSDDYPLPYLTWAELEEELSERAPVILATQLDNETVQTIHMGEHFHPVARFGGQVKPLLDRIASYTLSGEAVVVVSRQAPRLAELWSAQHAPGTPTESLTSAPLPGTATFVPGAISEGWRLEVPADTTLHLLTDAEIFGLERAQIRRRERRSATVAPEAGYASFLPGDFIVHEDFGVGRFRELGKRIVDGMEREYLVLEYAEGDELYVPVYQTDRLTRYVGSDDRPPTLSRLGSTEWHTTRSRARQAVEEMARELLELYAKRELVVKRPFGPDSPWQAELEGAFPFIETEDQARAIQEVKADMEKPRPMDRLICGDVGFGKTEVALRAAFKAVTDGAQVAVLVPTTVLAQQHYHTFQSRLAPYPINVEMLSRFRTPAQSKAILQQLAEGRVDVIIGTHRLLQKDVQFKNLGLLIVDEEQRFGVTHKERLKRLRTEVDVLTLTATPIPRTLYMALTGIRDISTINTPPEERLPVITHVGAYNEKLVRQAILRELDRGGQVFFVHNRVQSIGLLREKLERLAPEARLGVAHGQMDEAELSRVMDDFSDGKIDLLLCTSIIESGLDIPNANTLIVDRADTFGLAQLYQLRGRVGRSAIQAYAYFFTDKHHRPTPEARERLETLAEQTDLGAGYSIAMRDLEMRGAGDILGPKQSGQIAAVGFHLYTRLLAQAVKRAKGQAAGAVAPPLTELGANALVDLPLALSIPSEYIEDRKLRLQLYQRLANITEEGDLDALALELTDRFGPIPTPLENLLYQLRIKLMASRAGVLSVGSENGQIVVTLPAMLDEVDQAYYTYNVVEGARVSKNRIWLPRLPEPAWREALLELLNRLAQGKSLAASASPA